MQLTICRVLCENTEDIGTLQPLVFISPDVNNRSSSIEKVLHVNQLYNHPLRARLAPITTWFAAYDTHRQVFVTLTSMI